MLKKILMASGLALACACVTHAADCGTFAYVTNGGLESTLGGPIVATSCTIDGGVITLSNFLMNNAFGAPASIQDNGTSGFEIFWNPGVGTGQDTQFGYTVNSTAAISTVSLTNGGGTGSSIVEYVCSTGLTLNQGITACLTGTQFAHMTAGPGVSTTASLVPPETSFSAFKDISGPVSSFAQDFETTTPEPGALLLMGSGLIGLAGALRRKLAK